MHCSFGIDLTTDQARESDAVEPSSGVEIRGSESRQVHSNTNTEDTMPRGVLGHERVDVQGLSALHRQPA
jgi:hypothetical protein